MRPPHTHVGCRRRSMAGGALAAPGCRSDRHRDEARSPMVNSAARGPSGRPSTPAPRAGASIQRGHRSPPGVPRPARRRVLAAVQHRVPGSLPGRHELPRLPEPGRGGPLRGGLHPLARAQPGGGHVRLRLLRALRARLPPRRHRPAAGHPGHEALPRRVARPVGHPRRDAAHHPTGHDRGGRRRRSRRARRGARAGGRRPPGDGLRRAALRRRHDAHRRARLPAAARGHRDGLRARASAWASASASTRASAGTSPSSSSRSASTPSPSAPAP